MSINSPISYHLRELEIARNQEPPYYVMPRISENDKAILDIGCGIGQTFVASSIENGKLLVGLDIDLDSLLYGKGQFSYINYVNGTAECLPFKSDSFNFVFSRLSLPYTDIPRSLSEIRRVLKEDGNVWFVLHSFSRTLKELKKSVVKFGIKGTILRIYVIANGIFLHLFGKQFAFPLHNRYESFQTESGITKALKKAGFRNIAIHRVTHFIVTAQKMA